MTKTCDGLLFGGMNGGSYAEYNPLAEGVAMQQRREQALAGCLLGGAIGDALGLAYEGLSPRRLARLSPGPLRFRVFPGLALVSDDTEHAALTAQALLRSRGDVDRFERVLAWRLRLWIAALPAGVGWATGRALWKLWLGIPPGRNGVHSAGNGPAMRAAILGVYLARQPHTLAEHLARSTRLTHTDIRAEAGAHCIALAAAQASQGSSDPLQLAHLLAPVLEQDGEGMADFRMLMRAMFESVAKGERTQAFCAAQGWQRGVLGYVVHTVAAALHAWLSHPQDLDAALEDIIRSGGDVDSTAALVGGLVGAGVGVQGLPPARCAALRDWPWNQQRLSRLAIALARGGHQGSLYPCWPLALLRNLLFLLLVLGHGLRRLLPPY